MSTPATPNAALPLDALGMDSLPGDALAEGPTATADKATATLLKTVAILALGSISSSIDQATVAEYCWQVHGTRELRWFASAAQLRDILSEYAEIKRLILFCHSFEINDPPNRQADLGLGKDLVLLPELQRNLAGAMPKITTFIIDGCTVGRASKQLYDFAAHFGIGELQTWTYFHHIQRWGRPAEGSEPASETPAVLPYAAPYIPSGAYGGHASATQLIDEFTRTGFLSRVSEFFTYNMEDQLKFEQLLPKPGSYPANNPPSDEPWNHVRTKEDARYPRSVTDDNVIDSPEAALEFEYQVTNDKGFYRVRIRPK